MHGNLLDISCQMDNEIIVFTHGTAVLCIFWLFGHFTGIYYRMCARLRLWVVCILQFLFCLFYATDLPNEVRN